MLMVSGIAYSQPVENLVTNSGFEDGIGSPWWNNSPTHCFSDSQVFHSGNKSLRITVTDPETYVLVGQSVPVTPGEFYDIGTWIKTENVTSAGAHICIEWYGPSGWLGGEWSARKVTGTEDWQYTGVACVKIPEEATSASVLLCLIEGSTGTAWFDDVIVEKKAKPLMQIFVLRPNYRGRILPGAPSPEIKVEVTLNPEGHGLTLDELEIRAELKTETGGSVVQKNVKPLSSQSFNVDLVIPADTEPGDYDLTIALYKKTDSKLLAENTHDIEKLSPDDLASLTSYIDGYNRFILDGKPFFPLGLYVVQSLTDTSQLDEIADSHFDTLMNYNVNNGADSETAKYLDQLKSRNLKLIFSLKDYIGHGQEDIDTITHKVNTFKGHPALISWYMNDEYGLEYLPELEVRYQKVRELDKNHPVWSVHWRKYVLIEEAHTADALGVDPYPIPGNPITMVSEWADWAKEAGRGYRPLWLVPQIFRRDGHSPTREEMRAMTYLAVNHGAKGLIYYSYSDLRADENDYNERWPQIKKIANEIDYLKPVLLSPHQTNYNDIVCDNADIDFKLMREGNTYYLLAVNTKKDTIAAVSFRINLAHKPEAVTVLFEGDRQVVVNNGSFTDGFGPYEVHVYRWQGSNGGDGGGGGGCFIVTSAQESTMIGKVFNTIPGLIAATFMALLGIKMVIYRLSHIKFHKARERRLYCNTPTTDNAVKFNM
jgi:hypothetical protein